MRKRFLSLLFILALCLGLLPVTTLAANEWEHTSHEDDWTALTSGKLTDLEYTLTSGKYYLSGEDMGSGPFLPLYEVITIPENAEVILCLHDVYCASAVGAAIKVETGGTLTICDCSPKGDEDLQGYTNFFEEIEFPAIENHGTLNLASGNIGGVNLAVDNREGATLNLGGSPNLLYIISAGTISATYGGKPYTGSYFNTEDGEVCIPLTIDYTGEPGYPVVENVTRENCNFFSDPVGNPFDYDPDSGTLTATVPVTSYGSLKFAGSQTVRDGVYYQIDCDEIEDPDWGTKYYTVTLRDGDKDNYNLLWDEESKTLTLRNAEAIANVIGFQNAESLFYLASGTLTVNLIGENKITVYSHAEGVDWNAYAFESRGGGIVFQGDGSLAITMLPGTTQAEGIDITGIIASGTVDNRADLTISGLPGSLTWSGDMTGISCDSFTNNGTLDIKLSDLSNGVGIIVDGGAFDNSGAVKIQFSETDGVGIFLDGANSFQNSGSVTVDIPAADSAQGILRHSNQTENDFTWTNTAAGRIVISVSNQGAATAAMGGGALAGLDLRSGGHIELTNDGTLEVTAESERPASLSSNNWPSWQYFDTAGLLLLTDTCNLTNTGTMDLTALNGYTAGISVCADETSISIANSGTMDITTTTRGGENIRSVGIYAQLPYIQDGQVKELPFMMQGDAIRISTRAADGSNVEDDKLMGICLVQTFNGNVPGDLNSLQQIDAEGMALPGEPVVIKVDNDGTNKTAFINTIGTVATDGTIIPVTDMTVLPAISGTVTIGGSTLVGSTLTAQVTGLPSDATVSYQWQVSDSANGPFTNLVGENGTTLLLTNEHVGKYIRLVVTPTDGIYGGTLTAVTSSWVSYPSSDPSYSIKLDIGDHGSVHTSHRTAEEGETVTLTVTPDDGYVLKDLTVTDSNGKTVKLSSKGSNRYTFEVPARSVTVTAEFVRENVQKLPFTDVPGSAWYYDGVAYVYQHGLMAGTSATTFGPDVTTTRGMIATILWRLEGSPVVNYAMDYTDVAQGQWYSEAIRWAASEGIVSGYGDGRFGPDDIITREQMAAMLYRYAQYKGYDVSVGEDTNILSYTDFEDLSEYAIPAMQWAVGAGIISSTSESTLGPRGNASRAQVAVILTRYCESVAKQ